MTNFNKGDTAAYKKTVNDKILKINKEGAKRVLIEKPVITLNRKRKVIQVALNGVMIPRSKWRKHCPISRYDVNFTRKDTKACY